MKLNLTKFWNKYLDRYFYSCDIPDYSSPDIKYCAILDTDNYFKALKQALACKLEMYIFHLKNKGKKQNAI